MEKRIFSIINNQGKRNPNIIICHFTLTKWGWLGAKKNQWNIKKSKLFSLWVKVETGRVIIEIVSIFLETKKQERTKLKIELSDNPADSGAKEHLL